MMKTKTKSTKKKYRFQVQVWEHDSWSGPSLDSIKKFRTENAAKKYVKEFNSHNKSSTVPDWYMVAYNPEPISVVGF